MKITNKIFLAFLLLIALGCKDVLDKRDLNVVDDEVLWEDEAQATLYINKLYQDNMPDMSLGTNSGMTDEIFSSSQTLTSMLYGLVGETNIDDPPKVLHREKYQLIRQINIAINGLDGSGMNEEIVANLKGQALVLRAMRFWEMVQFNGGVPMILDVQDPYNDDLNVPRFSTSESISLIVSDLDDAIELLPVDWEQTENVGRFTSGAAAALKARILLNWASPLFNRSNNLDRWQDAYDAGTQAMELLSQMNVPRELHPDFSTIFTSNVINNTEAVIFKRFNRDISIDYTNGWEGRVRPPSTGGNGGFNPTWELVKAFPMVNGKTINDAESGYDSTYYWQNRDPRFYETIAFNGCTWDMEGRETGQKQWNYVRNIHENNRAPATGFWCRKATDPSIILANISETSTTWHELRYAEVLLNQAECANEIGNPDEALQLIRRIRERAGIEPGDGSYGIENSVSQNELRQLIMIERQVEFAFENKRYWDLRRRLMYRNDQGNLVKKLNGTKRHGLQTNVNNPWSRRVTDRESPYYGWNRIDTVTYLGHVDINDSQNYNTYFSTVYKEMESINSSTGEVYSINYLSLYDFFPVNSSFVQKSPAVEQTLGWLNGTFDPLAE